MALTKVSFKPGMVVTSTCLNAIQTNVESYIKNHKHDGVEAPYVSCAEVYIKGYDVNNTQNVWLCDHVRDASIHNIAQNAPGNPLLSNIGFITCDDWTYNGIYWEATVRLPYPYENSSYTTYLQPSYVHTADKFLHDLGISNATSKSFVQLAGMEGIVPLNNSLLDFTCFVHSKRDDSFKVRMYAVGTGLRHSLVAYNPAYGNRKREVYLANNVKLEPEFSGIILSLYPENSLVHQKAQDFPVKVFCSLYVGDKKVYIYPYSLGTGLYSYVNFSTNENISPAKHDLEAIIEYHQLDETRIVINDITFRVITKNNQVLTFGWSDILVDGNKIPSYICIDKGTLVEFYDESNLSADTPCRQLLFDATQDIIYNDATSVVVDTETKRPLIAEYSTFAPAWNAYGTLFSLETNLTPGVVNPVTRTVMGRFDNSNHPRQSELTISEGAMIYSLYNDTIIKGVPLNLALNDVSAQIGTNQKYSLSILSQADKNVAGTIYLDHPMTFPSKYSALDYNPEVVESYVFHLNEIVSPTEGEYFILPTYGWRVYKGDLLLGLSESSEGFISVGDEFSIPSFEFDTTGDHPELVEGGIPSANWAYCFGGFEEQTGGSGWTNVDIEVLSVLSDGTYFFHLNQHGLIEETHPNEILIVFEKTNSTLIVRKIYGSSGPLENVKAYIEVDNTDGIAIFRYGQKRAVEQPIDYGVYVTGGEEGKAYFSWYLGYPKDYNLTKFGKIEPLYQTAYRNGVVVRQPIMYLEGWGFYDLVFKRAAGEKRIEAISADVETDLNTVFNPACSLVDGNLTVVSPKQKIGKLDQKILFETGVTGYIPMSSVTTEGSSQPLAIGMGVIANKPSSMFSVGEPTGEAETEDPQVVLASEGKFYRDDIPSGLRLYQALGSLKTSDNLSPRRWSLGTSGTNWFQEGYTNFEVLHNLDAYVGFSTKVSLSLDKTLLAALYAETPKPYLSIVSDCSRHNISKFIWYVHQDKILKTAHIDQAVNEAISGYLNQNSFYYQGSNFSDILGASKLARSLRHEISHNPFWFNVLKTHRSKIANIEKPDTEEILVADEFDVVFPSVDRKHLFVFRPRFEGNKGADRLTPYDSLGDYDIDTDFGEVYLRSFFGIQNVEGDEIGEVDGENLHSISKGDNDLGEYGTILNKYKRHTEAFSGQIYNVSTKNEAIDPARYCPEFGGLVSKKSELKDIFSKYYPVDVAHHVDVLDTPIQISSFLYDSDTYKIQFEGSVADVLTCRLAQGDIFVALDDNDESKKYRVLEMGSILGGSAPDDYEYIVECLDSPIKAYTTLYITEIWRKNAVDISFSEVDYSGITSSYLLEQFEEDFDSGSMNLYTATGTYLGSYPWHKQSLFSFDIPTVTINSFAKNDPATISPMTGDRYVVASSGVGDWAGKENNIAEFNGTSWDFTVPKLGYVVFDLETSSYMQYDGSAWAEYAHTTWGNYTDFSQGQLRFNANPFFIWNRGVSSDLGEVNRAELIVKEFYLNCDTTTKRDQKIKRFKYILSNSNIDVLKDMVTASMSGCGLTVGTPIFIAVDKDITQDKDLSIFDSSLVYAGRVVNHYAEIIDKTGVSYVAEVNYIVDEGINASYLFDYNGSDFVSQVGGILDPDVAIQVYVPKNYYTDSESWQSGVAPTKFVLEHSLLDTDEFIVDSHKEKVGTKEFLVVDTIKPHKVKDSAELSISPQVLVCDDQVYEYTLLDDLRNSWDTTAYGSVYSGEINLANNTGKIGTALGDIGDYSALFKVGDCFTNNEGVRQDLYALSPVPLTATDVLSSANFVECVNFATVGSGVDVGFNQAGSLWIPVTYFEPADGEAEDSDHKRYIEKIEWIPANEELEVTFSHTEKTSEGHLVDKGDEIYINGSLLGICCGYGALDTQIRVYPVGAVTSFTTFTDGSYTWGSGSAMGLKYFIRKTELSDKEWVDKETLLEYYEAHPQGALYKEGTVKYTRFFEINTTEDGDVRWGYKTEEELDAYLDLFIMSIETKPSHISKYTSSNWEWAFRNVASATVVDTWTRRGVENTYKPINFQAPLGIENYYSRTMRGRPYVTEALPICGLRNKYEHRSTGGMTCPLHYVKDGDAEDYLEFIGDYLGVNGAHYAEGGAGTFDWESSFHHEVYDSAPSLTYDRRYLPVLYFEQDVDLTSYGSFGDRTSSTTYLRDALRLLPETKLAVDRSLRAPIRTIDTAAGNSYTEWLTPIAEENDIPFKIPEYVFSVKENLNKIVLPSADPERTYNLWIVLTATVDYTEAAGDSNNRKLFSFVSDDNGKYPGVFYGNSAGIYASDGSVYLGKIYRVDISSGSIRIGVDFETDVSGVTASNLYLNNRRFNDGSTGFDKKTQTDYDCVVCDIKHDFEKDHFSYNALSETNFGRFSAVDWTQGTSVIVSCNDKFVSIINSFLDNVPGNGHSIPLDVSSNPEIVDVASIEVLIDNEWIPVETKDVYLDAVEFTRGDTTDSFAVEKNILRKKIRVINDGDVFYKNWKKEPYIISGNSVSGYIAKITFTSGGDDIFVPETMNFRPVFNTKVEHNVYSFNFYNVSIKEKDYDRTSERDFLFGPVGCYQLNIYEDKHQVFDIFAAFDDTTGCTIRPVYPSTYTKYYCDVINQGFAPTVSSALADIFEQEVDDSIYNAANLWTDSNIENYIYVPKKTDKSISNSFACDLGLTNLGGFYVDDSKETPVFYFATRDMVYEAYYENGCYKFKTLTEGNLIPNVVNFSNVDYKGDLPITGLKIDSNDVFYSNAHRNAQNMIVAPVLMENRGYEKGNEGNIILDGLNLLYYTKANVSSTQTTPLRIYEPIVKVVPRVISDDINFGQLKERTMGTALPHSVVFDVSDYISDETTSISIKFELDLSNHEGTISKFDEDEIMVVALPSLVNNTLLYKDDILSSMSGFSVSHFLDAIEGLGKVTVEMVISGEALTYLTGKTLVQPLHVPLTEAVTEHTTYYDFDSVCEVSSLPFLGDAVLLQVVSLPFVSTVPISGDVLTNIEVSSA